MSQHGGGEAFCSCKNSENTDFPAGARTGLGWSEGKSTFFTSDFRIDLQAGDPSRRSLWEIRTGGGGVGVSPSLRKQQLPSPPPPSRGRQMDEDSEPCSRPAGSRSRGEAAGAYQETAHQPRGNEITCGNALKGGKKL